MFSREGNSVPETSGKRIILLIGGSGVLGMAFAEKKADNIFIVNVSRTEKLFGANILNYHADVIHNPRGLISELANVVPAVDVLIPMVYRRNFSSIERLNRETFLEEIELDTFIPLRMSLLCAEYFWSKEPKTLNEQRARKVINISSGAAFGKTSRPELASYSGAKAALNVMTEYLHDYLFSTHGVSAHVVAPGSLLDRETKGAAVKTLWDLEIEPVTHFTLTKIF